MSVKLVVGLGNPGEKYLLSYHNLGFLAVEAFARKHNLSEKPLKIFKGALFQGKLGEVPFFLLKPLSYMNLSGQVVRPVMDYYKISIPDLLVVSDDLDLPLAKLRLREKGGAGGHNGLKSLIQHLKTEDFARLRIGIGRSAQMAVEDYVLSKISKDSEPLFFAALEKAVEAIESFIRHGIGGVQLG